MEAGALHILVVEDDPDIREIILMVLGLEGFMVTGVAEGQGALEKVKADQPDVVLLDVLLGDRDGREICQEIKANPETRNIPVMMVSASHGYHDPGGPDCPADDFIAKPFDIHELVSRVKRLAA